MTKYGTKYGSFIELALKRKDEFLGDRVQFFYCVNCGYVELYRERNRETSSFQNVYKEAQTRTTSVF